MENKVRKQEKIYTPEEVAAYRSDMTLGVAEDDFD